MPKVVITGTAARRFTGGQTEVDVDADTVRRMISELERRFPGRVRLLAPSETKAARTQLGSRRFKTDDRDCAALVWLLRQGLGRLPQSPALDGLLGAVRHRRQLVAELKILRQRDRKSTRLNSSHCLVSRMPSSA